MVAEGLEKRAYPLREALQHARERQLDLVEIAPKATPPVCKIIDYTKFKYEYLKKQKQLKTRTPKVSLKEVRFSPTTSVHDFDFKQRHAQKFLASGAHVKAYVQFRGRQIVHKAPGEQLLERFLQALAPYGKPEQPPRMEGRRMVVHLLPHKNPAKPAQHA